MLPLTLLEEKIVAPQRAARYVIVLGNDLKRRGDSSGENWPHGDRTDTTAISEMRGHVVAYPNPTGPNINQLLSFPVAPEDLPNFINVAFIAPAETEDEVSQLASRSQTLSVRGPVVVAWCLHLAEM